MVEGVTYRVIEESFQTTYVNKDIRTYTHKKPSEITGQKRLFGLVLRTPKHMTAHLPVPTLLTKWIRSINLKMIILFFFFSVAFSYFLSPLPGRKTLQKLFQRVADGKTLS